MCYANYPTIVNNIGKDTTVYNNTPDDFAVLDSRLAKSQRDIGESSNLAQLAQTYAASFPGIQKYNDYVCILSVIAQIAIDSAKRCFNVDVTQEIARIKKDMDVDTNGYPEFWLGIKRGFNKSLINPKLVCPMNCLYELDIDGRKRPKNTLDISEFFIYTQSKIDRRKSKKVEALIEKYGLEYWKNIRADADIDNEKWIIMRSDFDEMINDIRQISLSLNYQELMSWLINRAFIMTPNMKSNRRTVKLALSKNRPLLLKTLYTINPQLFLSCFVHRE